MGWNEANAGSEQDSVVVLLLKEAMNEHNAEMARLSKENQRLSLHLNSVLQATWNFSNESWHGSPARPDYESALVLLAEDSPNARGLPPGQSRAHSVPEEFHNPSRAVEIPDTFELRKVWHNWE